MKVSPDAIENLWSRGYGRLGTVLSQRECEAIRSLYAQPEHFRSRIDMARYRFGRGEYQYFNYPLPDPIGPLRRELYCFLAPTARDWMTALSLPKEYPADLATFLDQCHEAGQSRPTPLLLRYQAGDFNCLHQDLYGEMFFPFQVVVGLSRPDEEFTGGEFAIGGTAAASAICRARDSVGTRRGSSHHHAVSPGEGNAGPLPHEFPARSESAVIGGALHAGDYLPRCGVALLQLSGLIA